MVTTRSSKASKLDSSSNTTTTRETRSSHVCLANGSSNSKRKSNTTANAAAAASASAKGHNKTIMTQGTNKKPKVVQEEEEEPKEHALQVLVTAESVLSKDIIMDQIATFSTVPETFALSRTNRTLHCAVVKNFASGWTCQNVQYDATSEDEEEEGTGGGEVCGRRIFHGLFHGHGVPDACKDCGTRRCGRCTHGLRECASCPKKECAACMDKDEFVTCFHCEKTYLDCCAKDACFACFRCQVHFCNSCSQRYFVNNEVHCWDCVLKCDICRYKCDDTAEYLVYYCHDCATCHCSKCHYETVGQLGEEEEYCQSCIDYFDEHDTT